MGTRKTQNGRPGAVEQTPQAFTREQHVQMIAAMLQQVQGRLRALRLEQVTNGLGDDQVAGMSAPQTVGELRAELLGKEQNILREYAEYLDEVAALIEAAGTPAG
jgi:hypothetical protein